MWCLYILQCQNGLLYTGITDNLSRRFKEHRQRIGGHFTSCNRPIQIVYSEKFSDKSEAQEREKQIKRWSKAKKLALAKGQLNELRQLSISKD